jgi:hypothetical protein
MTGFMQAETCRIVLDHQRLNSVEIGPNNNSLFGLVVIFGTALSEVIMVT